MSADPQLRHDSDKVATIRSVEHDLLRYRLERPVDGSGPKTLKAGARGGNRREIRAASLKRLAMKAVCACMSWPPMF
jgi:hypothetical protein